MKGDWEQIRGRYLRLRDGQGESALGEPDDRVAKLIDTQITDPAHAQCGGWGDVTDCASPALASEGTSLLRMLRLAEAWAAAGGRWQGDAALAGRLTLAARFYARVLKPTEPFPHNGWYWQVGIPRELSLIFLLAGDAFV